MNGEREDRVRVAVASKNGDVVDLHFGHAEKFFIYEADHNGRSSLVETRTVFRYCMGEETYSHPFEQERFMSIVETIQDCELLLCSGIGVVPERRLKESGINTVMAYDRVENVISQVCKKVRCKF